jgi:hypothetical protein
MMRDDAMRDVFRSRRLALGSRGAGTGGHSGEGRRPGVRLAAVLLAACALALMSAGGAYAYWTLTATGSGAAAAATVGAGAKPTVSGASKAVTVSWSASTLSDGVAVSGYLIKRYAFGGETVQVALAGCSGTITATTCTEAGVPEGQWQYTVTPVFATNWQGHESARSEKLVIDTTGPVHSLSLTAATGAYLSGSTVYYKGNVAGSLKFVDALSDPVSGAVSTTFPAIATTGWTHSAETVSTPTGGPFVSGAFTWSANPSKPSGYALSGLNGAGLTTSLPLTFTSDITAPSGGSISYTNATFTTLSVPLTLATGADSGSGVDTAAAVVRRDETTQSGNKCRTFPGTYATIVTLVGGADTSVVSGNCYMYEYLVPDFVGNTATYTSASVAKVSVP